MKEIDWSKAPEGATHYGPEAPAIGGRWAAAFFRRAGSGQWQFWDVEDKGPWQDVRFFHEDWPDRIAGLIPRPAPWPGDGPPPVGTVCEVLNNTLDHPEWERCTILFMGKFKAVYESESCHERVADVSEDWMISFRPPSHPRADRCRGAPTQRAQRLHRHR